MVFCQCWPLIVGSCHAFFSDKSVSSLQIQERDLGLTCPGKCINVTLHMIWDGKYCCVHLGERNSGSPSPCHQTTLRQAQGLREERVHSSCAMELKKSFTGVTRAKEEEKDVDIGQRSDKNQESTKQLEEGVGLGKETVTLCFGVLVWERKAGLRQNQGTEADRYMWLELGDIQETVSKAPCSKAQQSGLCTHHCCEIPLTSGPLEVNSSPCFH